MTIIEQSESLRQQALQILMAERQEIDTQMAKLGFTGEAIEPKGKKTRTCSKCGQSGHNAKSCTATP